MKKTNVTNVVKAMVKGFKLAKAYDGKLDGIMFTSDWKHIHDVYDIKCGKTTLRVNCEENNLWKVLVIIDDVPEEVVYELAMF